MFSLFSRFARSAKFFVVVAAIACIPLIYSGALIWANQDPTHHLDAVPAAVVDLDQPAALGDETIDLGATLSEDLTTSNGSTNFDWTAMDSATASSKLDSGEILAVLTVPQDFSANAASVDNADPMQATTAGLSIETNDGANMVSGTIATTIGSTIRATLAAELSDEYLSNIYVGFTAVHDKVADAADGADTLADGAGAATEGAGQLVLGLDELASGSALLADGTASLASGATRASSGAAALAVGLGTLQSTTAALPDQAAHLASGAETTAAGAASLAESLSSLATAADHVADGTSAALDGATQLRTGLAALSTQTPALVDGAEGISTETDALLDNYAAMTDGERQAALEHLSTDAGNVSRASESMDSAVQTLSSGAGALVGSADDGTGLASLEPGATALSRGATDASTGAATLDSGVAAVAAGTSAFSLRVPELVSAIGSAASGAVALSDGASDVAAGASTLSTKTGALAVGSLKALSGGEQLDSGLSDLETGETALSDGLHAGLDDIPSYTLDEAEHLSGVTADPVTIDSQREHEVPAYGYGLAPYFLALALWVGALAFYLMMPPLSRRALAGDGRSVIAALRSYLPGVLMGITQSTLAVLVLTNVLGVQPANTWGLFGMMTLTSLTFVAINQALVALLGAPGRFLGLMLIVLQLSAAGGTYPIQTAPAFFQTIHQWLPLTYSVESFRSLIAGGTIGIEQGIWVLTIWLIGALGVTAMATVRARRKILEQEQEQEQTPPVQPAANPEQLSSARHMG